MGFTCPDCGEVLNDMVDFNIHRTATGHAKDLRP